MKVYVVVTEGSYGGGEKKMRAFIKRLDAEKYMETVKKKDCKIIEGTLADNNAEIYVSVTEQRYGGGVGIFSEERDAIEYSNVTREHMGFDAISVRLTIL